MGRCLGRSKKLNITLPKGRVVGKFHRGFVGIPTIYLRIQILVGLVMPDMVAM
ncbi:hypothetical protein [Leptospira weilii]|uniref:hypothetical protein n=1 Tax=Leptospira weilii TaxID=28184 RepID=UPI000ADA6A34|nr:hypothetical protein [Leptospira weilii]ULH28915.1 hypothetical protein FH586_02910 [Leptospira weilii]